MTIRNIRFVKSEETSNTIEEREEKKKRLRSYMKERRSQNENRDVKERLLVENFFKAVFEESEGAGTHLNLFVYLSYSSEAPTDKLIESMQKDGHTVYAPRVNGQVMEVVEYKEDFTLSKFGIREPVGEVYKGNIDVAVIPLLAVDKRGYRLGYGGGYYDRYLKENPKVLRVGYCYDFQVLEDIPQEAWDEKLDMLVTDKRIIRFAKRLQ